MMSTLSICLIKDFPLESPRGGMPIVETNAVLEGPTEPFASLPSVCAITEHLQELKNRKSTLLSLSTNSENQRMCFEICFYRCILDDICRILGNPYLKILCKIKGPSTGGDMMTLEKRYDLRETDVSTWLSLFTTSVSINEEYSCDIVLEWKEHVQHVSMSTRMDTLSFMHNLFERDYTKDLTLVAGGNGAEIKCHRVIFEAHSDVFAAMLSPDNGMQESKTGRIKMSENSEYGLSHLIRYLYGKELETDELSCDVAIELFKTAHMFNFIELLDWLRQLLTHKGGDWYSPDDLLELYFHVKNLSEFKGLEEYLLSIMPSLTHEIRSCERFTELKQTDSEAASALLLTLLNLEVEMNSVI